MKTVIFYLLIFLATLFWLLVAYWNHALPEYIDNHKQFFYCGLSGGFGGVVYCLRGVYINASVKKNWDALWLPWYFLRPFVSVICGGASCLFLKTGLLVLDSVQKSGATDFGFLALAFIAGLNVDKFISKIEDIAQATWGIEKSRASKNESSGTNSETRN